MKQISSLDLHYLVKEFKILENQRVDSFYFEDEVFYLRVYVRGGGHKYLTNKVSKYIYLGDSKVDANHPKSFISYLRKYLKGSFIREISQIFGERILKVVFEQKIEEELKKFNLYLELFANGNIILCGEENIILNALSKKKYKDRTVMVRDIYELPPSTGLSINSSEKEVQELMSQSDLSLVKFLAIKFGLGGKFSEEICFRLDVDKNMLVNEFKEIVKLIKILREIYSYSGKGYVLEDENKIIDFFPFKFKSVSNLIEKDSFNDCIQLYFKQFKEDISVKDDSYTKELKKLENRVLKQKESMKKIEIESSDLSNMGNKIYENYILVEELLTSINRVSKEKGWDYVLDKIKSDEKLSKIVKKLNYKNNEIILDL